MSQMLFGNKQNSFQLMEIDGTSIFLDSDKLGTILFVPKKGLWHNISDA